MQQLIDGNPVILSLPSSPKENWLLISRNTKSRWSRNVYIIYETNFPSTDSIASIVSAAPCTSA